MITAKIKLNSTIERPNADGSIDQVDLFFGADYADGRNKEWAKWTPGLSLTVGVKPEVAEKFEVGEAYTLTFTPSED